MTAPTKSDWAILAKHGVTPDNLNVDGWLYLSGCTGLTGLPDNLNVGGSLYLTGCTGLTGLPDNLNVGGSLCLTGCTGLTVALNDPRGYELRIVTTTGRPWIVAGCRKFRSVDDAIAHWGGDNYPDKQRGAKYVAAIRASLEASA